MYFEYSSYFKLDQRNGNNCIYTQCMVDVIGARLIPSHVVNQEIYIIHITKFLFMFAILQNRLSSIALKNIFVVKEISPVLTIFDNF